MTRIINTRDLPPKISRKRCKYFPGSWKRTHPWCLICGIPYGEATRLYWPGLTLMHIVGGSGRSDEPCNVMSGCMRCHSCEHNGPRFNGVLYATIRLEHLLWVKRERDPKNYDPARLAVLAGHCLPEPVPLPEIFLAEWRRWRK